MDLEQAEALNGAIRTIAIRHRALAARVLADLGLHPGHEAVLFALANDGSQTQVQLARRAGCEPPSITVMVQKLQAKGLVDRRPVPGNARATAVELTERGRALLPRLRERWIQLAQDTVAGLVDRDLRDVTSTLAAVATSLEQRADARQDR